MTLLELPRCWTNRIVAVGQLTLLGRYCLCDQADPRIQIAQNPLVVFELSDARLDGNVPSKGERDRKEQQNHNSAQHKVLADQRAQIDLQLEQLEAMQSVLDLMHGGDPMAFGANRPPTTRPTNPDAWAPPQEAPDLVQPERPQQTHVPTPPQSERLIMDGPCFRETRKSFSRIIEQATARIRGVC
jgi:hypothetical protein